MPYETLHLDADPAAALTQLRQASRDAPTVVFKASPICPVSRRAEGEYRRWLADCEAAKGLKTVVVDVIDQRALARGLTAELGVQHESPQALWFEHGELRWHGSHAQLTKVRFEELYGASAM